MNIVFFGTSRFAVPALKGLIASKYKISAVVTQPDRKKGRHLKLSIPAIKDVALKNNIRILQLETLDQGFIGELKTLKPDLFIVIAFGHILKKEILNIPRLYSINLHASLLPKYRGAAPINWAIIKGETKTGLTIIRMNEGMDEGDIISSKAVDILPEDTSLSLSEKLSQIGADLLLGTLEHIERKKEKFIKQDSKKATYARKLSKEDGLIDWRKDAKEIHNIVRGLIPWPGAYTILNKKILKIWKTQILDEDISKPAKIVKAKGDLLIVGTGRGLIRLLEVQLEAGKKMDVASFLRGHRINEGETFSLTH